MVELSDIESVARQLGDAVNAERVVLFGSHARGNPSEHSDVDLLIVAESDQPRFKRSQELYRLLRPHPFAMDLVVYTPEEVRRDLRSRASFVSMVLREGRVIYAGRPGDREAMGRQGEG